MWYKIKIYDLVLILLFFFSSEKNLLADDHIRLGAILPLTGEYATYGNLIRDGIELAKSEQNQKKIYVDTFYEDLPTPGMDAVTSINKLIHYDKIQAVAGNFWNGVIPIISPIANENKIPVFHSAIADDYILDAGDLVFSTNAKSAEESKKIVEYSINKLNAKTAVILYVGTNWGEVYAKHIAENFKALGGNVLLVDTTMLQTTDFRAILLKIRSLRPDIFFACYFGTNIGLVLKQARENGLTMPIFGPYESEDKSVIDTAKEKANDLLFFVPQDDSQPEAKNFIRNFQLRYNYPPTILAKNAYDATKILISAINTCNNNISCIKQNIYSIKLYRGASGIFSIDADGAASKNFVLKTIKNGNFIEVK